VLSQRLTWSSRRVHPWRRQVRCRANGHRGSRWIVFCRSCVAAGSTSQVYVSWWWNCVYTPTGGAVSRQHGRPVPWSPAAVVSALCLAPRRPRCNFVIIRGEQVEKFKFVQVRSSSGAQPASDLAKSESPPVEETSSVPCQWASWIKIDRLLQIVCSRRFNQSSICEPVVKCRDDRSPYIEKTSQLRSPYGVRLLVASGTTSWNCVYTPIGGAVSRQHGRPVPWSPATVMSAPCLAPRRPRCNFVIIRGEQVEKFKFGRQRRRGGGRWSCESSPASATSSGSSSTTRLRR